MAPRRPSRKKQTRLTFTPVPSSSPAAKASTSRVLSNVRFDSPRRSKIQDTLAGSKPTRRVDLEGHDDATDMDDSDIHIQLPTPDQSSQPVETATPTRRSRRLIRRGSPSTSDHASEESPIRPVRSGNRRSTKPIRTDRQTRRSDIAPTSQTAAAGIVDIGEAETSDDDLTFLTSKPTRKRRTRNPPVNEDDFIVGDDTIEPETSEDEDIAPRPSRRITARPISGRLDVENQSETSDEDNSVVSPKRKSHGRLLRTPNKRKKQEEEDLEEDLEDLADSAVRDSRTRGAPVNSARDKYRQGLEALKRSREKRSTTGPSGPRDPVVIDTDDEDDKGVEEGEERVMPIFPMTAPSRSLSVSSHSEEPDSEDLDGYEEDFVEDDDDGHVNPSELLPLEFSRWATAPPRDHFRNVIEWLVKNKIAPAFDRNNELFDLSFRKINDEVKAQAGSRYISSVWKPDFKRALEARPDLEAVHVGMGTGRSRTQNTILDADDDDEADFALFETCQACGRTGHPATWTFQFKGHAYHHDTLERMGRAHTSSSSSSSSTSSSSSSSSEDSDADANSVNSRAQPLAPMATHFQLGRTCAANAAVAHKLSHWKFHLNRYMLALLASSALLTPEAIVRRDARSQRKREKEADAFVNALVAGGEMDELWRTWRRELTDVRRGMEDWDDAGGPAAMRKSRGARGTMSGGQGTLGMWMR